MLTATSPTYSAFSVVYGGASIGYFVRARKHHDSWSEVVTVAGPFTSHEQADERRRTMEQAETGEAPTLTINYGPDGRYVVQFRLPRGRELQGRYLPSPDGHGRREATEWETRTADTDDPDHVRIIAALTEVLAQFTYGATDDDEGEGA